MKSHMVFTGLRLIYYSSSLPHPFHLFAHPSPHILLPYEVASSFVVYFRLLNTGNSVRVKEVRGESG